MLVSINQYICWAATIDITDYITKSQLKSHVAYAALQLAVKRCEDVDDADDDFTVRSKHLLQKCAYALVSHQEMSAQQVASYLMGYEDHFTSHQFNNLYWASFERFIEQHDGEKLCPACGGRVDVEVDSGKPTGDVVSECDDYDRDAEEGDGGGDGLEGDDEEVSIRVDEHGDVAVLADQVTDYTLRPQELQAMCLWDFVAKAEKVVGQKSREPAADDGEGNEEGTGDVSHRESHHESCVGGSGDVNDDASHDQLEDGVSGGLGDSLPQKGQKRVKRFEFLEGHKECSRKLVQLRDRDAVPVLIGPATPRRDQPEARPRYCRLMLTLFKPWRTLVDLREGSQSWESTFQVLSTTMNDNQRRIVNNMQVLHECRDSRNDHMQTRIRERSKNVSTFAPHEEAPGNDIEDVNMAEVLEHLDDIDRMSTRRHEDANRDAQECLDQLTKAGFFCASGLFDAPQEYNFDGHHVVQPELAQNDGNLEDGWRDVYEKRKAAWKLEVRRCGEDETPPTTSINQASNIESASDSPPLITDAETAGDYVAAMINGSALMGQIAEKWTLNKEQNRVFNIVAEHTMMEKPHQLLMYLGGPGGTGKSRVVNALRDFFESRSETRRFRLAAYTGVAARNIGGATLHSLLQMNESGKNMSVKAKRDLSAMWEGVDYLFVDELSMIGCEMLHNVSRALTEAKGSTAAFGGVNVILAGDFAQLPPIGDTRLYKDINTSSLAAAATNRAQGKVLGRLLWLSFETVVILHEAMRQSGSENTPFVNLLQRLRDGVCDDSDYNMLANRTPKMLPPPPNWSGMEVCPRNCHEQCNEGHHQSESC